MLKTPYLTREWAYENIGKDPFLDWDYEPSCARRVCEGWPSDIAEKPWMVLEGYSSRYEQNQLIWKAGELFGSGIWNFNPLGNNAPKGLCSVDRSIFQAESSFHKVYGIKMSSVVATEAIPFILDCQVDSNDFCIAHTNDVVKPKNRKGLFFTKTITFKSQDSSSSENNYSTLTIGSSLNEVLQKLALIVPGSILYVTEDGQSLFYSEDGRIYDQSEWSNIDFTNMINQPSGMIKNIKGQEFLFLHLMPIFEGKGQIFVVELKQNIFQILTQLKQQVKMLVKKLFYENLLIGFIALLVGLIILNKILKNGIKPLSYLVEITHLVSSGKLEEIQIPIKWKERKDEIGALLTSFDEMVKEMKEGRKVRSILDKVVSKDVAEKILKDGVELGGEIREVTILFADIRNFTHISESLKPEEVLEMLNSCLTVLSKVIDDFGGVIDKYIGDEIMAIFGAPVAMENSALVAIQAAKKMIEILEEWNEIRKSRNLLPLAIGISIHTGNVIAGNIGAENHLSYTVLGHNVNLASRMVDLASPMEILVTQDVYEKATKVMNVKADSLEAQMFKGISKPIALFRITT
jgi:class 3 adenylate cyclase